MVLKLYQIEAAVLFTLPSWRNRFCDAYVVNGNASGIIQCPRVAGRHGKLHFVNVGEGTVGRQDHEAWRIGINEGLEDGAISRDCVVQRWCNLHLHVVSRYLRSGMKQMVNGGCLHEQCLKPNFHMHPFCAAVVDEFMCRSM